MALELIDFTIKIPKDMKQEIKSKLITMVKILISDTTYTGAKAKADADKQEFEQANQEA